MRSNSVSEYYFRIYNIKLNHKKASCQKCFVLNVLTSSPLMWNIMGKQVPNTEVVFLSNEVQTLFSNA